MTDWAHTPAAQEARRRKARLLAVFCWDRGLTSADVQGMDTATRIKLAHRVGVHPPSGQETWDLVAALLDDKRRWADRHPTDPRAHPALAQERPLWADANLAAPSHGPVIGSAATQDELC